MPEGVFRPVRLLFGRTTTMAGGLTMLLGRLYHAVASLVPRFLF